MTIFTTTSTSPPPSEAIANYLLGMAEGEIARRATEHAEQWVRFWQNENATPAEIAARMGANAAKWFTLAAINRQAFQTAEQVLGVQVIDPTYLDTPIPVTLNADGTVTIGPAL